MLLEGLDPQRAVAAAARKNDADGAVALILREAAQEDVDGVTLVALGVGLAHLQTALPEGEHRVRCDDVDVAGLDRVAVLGTDDRHGGEAPDDLGQHALPARCQMGDDHEADPQVGRHAAKEELERLDAAGGRPNPCDQASIDGHGDGSSSGERSSRDSSHARARGSFGHAGTIWLATKGTSGQRHGARLSAVVRSSKSTQPPVAGPERHGAGAPGQAGWRGRRWCRRARLRARLAQ